MIYAADVEAGALYRPTRNPSPGVHYTPSRMKPATIISRLTKRQRILTGAECWVLNRLDRGWVPMMRVTRWRGEDGKPHTDRTLTAMPPDYRLREIAKPPAMRSRLAR